MNIDKYIDQFSESSESFDSFEFEGFVSPDEMPDSFELEQFEDAIHRRRIRPSQAAQQINQRRAALGRPPMTPRGLKARITPNPKNTGSAGFGQGANFTAPVVAQFDLVIRRLTSQINAPLPFILFGAVSANANYAGILLPPPGITVSGVFTRGQASAEFRFTDGTNTDIIIVSTTGDTNYIEFLTANLVDMYMIEKMRYSVSNPALLNQFNNGLKVQSKSLFGTKRESVINVNSYKSPDQFQNVIIDVNQKVKIDKETLIRSEMVRNTAADQPFEIGLSVFVSVAEKFNATLLSS